MHNHKIIKTNEKKILILNTGGTISSIKSTYGYEPVAGYVESVMSTMPLFKHRDLPRYNIQEYDPLLDSSNMTIDDWNRMGCDIAAAYDEYDGFVILHGTDTMAYTAAALSFMLENLSKPVIITGSQIPLSEVRNDALDNIITALWLCAHQPINEVCIYFNQYLVRGNRGQKVHAQLLHAFDSPNFPHLAMLGIQIELQHELLLPKPTGSFRLQTMIPQLLANFRLFPGFSVAIFESLIQQPLRGLILETYGSGNAPNNNPYFLNLLKKACAAGMIIVNCTQCYQGKVEMHQYATGHGLYEAGLISGHDMTKEAIHCKLQYLLSKKLTNNKIKRKMEENICGELGVN
ncbi:MAG: L-asparaginase 1 [Legionellales bacterium RIFCSPHIGHO2_12_FULL_42_9]|nr:MAG: L-asparaginase 1 [Legionellales bacterium RIFCSPHIGHO2_12_FULL_42_9]